MGLFKDVKKPAIRTGSTGGAEISSKRPLYQPKEAPCMTKCPMGNHVRDWLVPLAQHEAYGRTQAEGFATAWRQITETNPFPAICGRICQHSCESACNRKTKDGAVGINLMERFVGDYGVTHDLQLPKPTQSRPQAVAIVGAGPSGLACAYYLASRGYQVSLFEAAAELGGMMRYGVPRSVIPAEVLNAEVGRIVQLGVDCHCNCVVGQDVKVDDLRRKYQAIFFAMGLQKPTQLQPVAAEDGVLLVSQLPETAPEARLETNEVTTRINNSVSLAVAQGLAVGESLVHHFEGIPDENKQKATSIGLDRMKLAWYPTLEPHLGTAREAASLGSGLSEADAIAEAKRCMSCGMCMDCESCWMYCTPNCIKKLPKGEHYHLKLDLCNGCGKCQETCPCGFIEMN